MPTKTKKHTTVVKIPLSPPCLAWLQDRKGFFFPTLRKQPTSNTSMQFSALMKKADVPKDIEITDELSASRSFHSLRHSFNTWLTEAGVDAEIRMKLTGHTTDKNHANYTHHSDEALARAVATLPSFTA